MMKSMQAVPKIHGGNISYDKVQNDLKGQIKIKYLADVHQDFTMGDVHGQDE